MQPPRRPLAASEGGFAANNAASLAVGDPDGFDLGAGIKPTRVIVLCRPLPNAFDIAATTQFPAPYARPDEVPGRPGAL